MVEPNGGGGIVGLIWESGLWSATTISLDRGITINRIL
jgi:hypothetical protein